MQIMSRLIFQVRILATLGVVLLVGVSSTHASYGIYVGKNLTADGSVFLAGYGQVAHLRKGVPDELGVLWVAAASSTTAPFIPWHIGATEVPPEFQRHRYLTEGEAEAFQDLERQGLESTKYAFRVFKRLFYLTKEHPERFQPEMMEAFTAFESGLIADQSAVEKTALTLFNARENDLARKYLTAYSSGKALDGLRLGEALAESLEVRTKVLFGIRQPRPTP